MRHANGQIWFGVDVDGPEGVRDNMEAFVWEPSLVKINAINSATEAASLILSVDETVRNPQSENVSVQLFAPANSWLMVVVPRLARRGAVPATGSRSEGIEGTRSWYAKTVDRVIVCTNISCIASTIFPRGARYLSLVLRLYPRPARNTDLHSQSTTINRTETAGTIPVEVVGVFASASETETTNTKF